MGFPNTVPHFTCSYAVEQLPFLYRDNMFRGHLGLVAVMTFWILSACYYQRKQSIANTVLLPLASLFDWRDSRTCCHPHGYQTGRHSIPVRWELPALPIPWLPLQQLKGLLSKRHTIGSWDGDSSYYNMTPLLVRQIVAPYKVRDTVMWPVTRL